MVADRSHPFVSWVVGTRSIEGENAITISTCEITNVSVRPSAGTRTHPELRFAVVLGANFTSIDCEIYAAFATINAFAFSLLRLRPPRQLSVCNSNVSHLKGERSKS
jgi:hypothetical protein